VIVLKQGNYTIIAVFVIMPFMNERITVSGVEREDEMIADLAGYGFVNVQKEFSYASVYKATYMPEEGGRVVFGFEFEETDAGVDLLIMNANAYPTGEGHGTKAGNQLIRWAKKYNFRRTAALPVTNKKAMKFWENLGFEKDEHSEFGHEYVLSSGNQKKGF